MGKLSWMKAISVDIVKENEVVERQESGCFWDIETARKIKLDSWVYTDTYRSYDALDVSEFHHERINHSELFAVK